MLPQNWTEPVTKEYLDDLKTEAARRFRALHLPVDKENWLAWRPQLLEALRKAIKVYPDHSLPLDVIYTGQIKCDGYVVHKLHYQSRPGIRTTGALYVPDGDGPFPALVNMHGHWPQGHLAASEQYRCHIMAKSGYVVLSVDAVGAGDRSETQGKYDGHSVTIGGRLFNIGETLMGDQVIDNMRAVDVLCSLPSVDRENIGAYGASGGGNQTMYLAAFDERIKAAAPIVSVGTFQSYVGSYNCICEVIPDGLCICEEAALLALVAPRSIKPFNGMHDIPCFMAPEMHRSYAEALKVFKALDIPERLESHPMPCGHAFPPDAQSVLLAYFDLHLKGSAYAPKAKVPSVSTIPEEDLMVFSPNQRPADFTTIQMHLEIQADAMRGKASLAPADLARIICLDNAPKSVTSCQGVGDGWKKYTIRAGEHIIPVLAKQGTSNVTRILAATGGKNELENTQLIQDAFDSTDNVIVFELFGTGENGKEDTRSGEFHILSRSLLWLGKRLIGEWTQDFLTIFDFAEDVFPGSCLHIQTLRDAGLAALYATVLSQDRKNPQQIRKLELTNMPKSLVEAPSQNMTMLCCIPGILEYGDIDQTIHALPDGIQVRCL